MQVALLILFGMQYNAAQDTLATFTGNEEDQQKLLFNTSHDHSDGFHDE